MPMKKRKDIRRLIVSQRQNALVNCEHLHLATAWLAVRPGQFDTDSDFLPWRRLSWRRQLDAEPVGALVNRQSQQAKTPRCRTPGADQRHANIIILARHQRRNRHLEAIGGVSPPVAIRKPLFTAATWRYLPAISP